MVRISPRRAVARSLRFLTYDMWHMPREEVKGGYQWVVSVLKAVWLSIRFFLSDRIMEKASALTYYTLLAIVPLFALILGIGRGFSLQDTLRDAMVHAFPGQDQAIGYIFHFAGKYLDNATSGWMLGIGVIMLLYVIYSLIGNVETVFNQIWQQKKGRSTLRKVTDYLSIMIIVPIFLVLSSGSQIFLQTYIRTGIFTAEVSHTLLTCLRWLPYGFAILLFMLIYIVIPHAKVRVRNAFIAALIAGSLYVVFQQLYISGQIWVSKYNAVYGSFAALPLLLLWIQMAWIICLYGAEFTFASQNIENFDYEKDTKNISRHYRDFLTVIVAGFIYHKFQQQEPSPSTEEVCRQLRIPARLNGEIIQDLAEREVIRPTTSSSDADKSTWLPGRDISRYAVADLIDEMHGFGSTDFGYRYSDFYPDEWQLLENMSAAAHREGSTLLLCDIKPKAIQRRPLLS